MRINHNIAALNTYRQLTANNANGSKSLEKLSSGYRINRAGDDAAGLAISEKMRAQIRGLGMASKNSQDAISLIQTAEGALGETHSILQRMRELAVQSSNDTNVTIDRSQIQKEMTQLSSEINRISNTTEFNTMKLVNGDRSIVLDTSKDTTVVALGAGSKDVSLITGYTVSADNSANLKAAVSSVATVAGEFITGSTGGGSIQISKTATGFNVVLRANDSAGATAFSAADTLVADSNGDFTYNNHGVSFTITAAEGATISTGSTLTLGTLTVSAATTYSTGNDWTANTGNVTLTSGITIAKNADNTAVRKIAIEVSGFSATNTMKITLLDSSDNTVQSDIFTGTANTTLSYNDHGFTFDLKNLGTAAVTASSAIISLSTLVSSTFTASTETIDHSLKFQVGANQNQQMGLDINDMRASALKVTSATAGSAAVTVGTASVTAYYVATKNVTDGTDSTNTEYSLDVSTAAKAGAAVSVLDNAVNLASEERAKLGAVQNRLEHTISNLDTSAENLQAAESRIRDVDMAKEMMEFTKNNILTQAAQSMLAQANQQPQGVLQLLR